MDFQFAAEPALFLSLAHLPIGSELAVAHPPLHSDLLIPQVTSWAPSLLTSLEIDGLVQAFGDALDSAPATWNGSFQFRLSLLLPSQLCKEAQCVFSWIRPYFPCSKHPAISTPDVVFLLPFYKTFLFPQDPAPFSSKYPQASTPVDTHPIKENLTLPSPLFSVSPSLPNQCLVSLCPHPTRTTLGVASDLQCNEAKIVLLFLLL